MKKFILMAIVLMAFASAQYKYTVGAFYKDFIATGSNTYTQIGLLPASAFVSSIRVFMLTNVSVATNTLLSVGIPTLTNAYISLLPILSTGRVETAVTTISNGGYVWSYTSPTAISGRFTYVGDTSPTNYTFRVLVNYIQR